MPRAAAEATDPSPHALAGPVHRRAGSTDSWPGDHRVLHASQLPSLHTFWLVFHVAVAILSAALFTIAFSVTILFLLKARREASPSSRPNFMESLPDAATRDRIAYGLHVVAFPVWTFTLIAGAIWAEQAVRVGRRRQPPRSRGSPFAGRVQRRNSTVVQRRNSTVMAASDTSEAEPRMTFGPWAVVLGIPRSGKSSWRPAV